MRFVAFKQNIKTVASWLGIVALALALGIGATSAMLHPGLLDVMQPSADAAVFNNKTTTDDSLSEAPLIADEAKGPWLGDLLR